MSGSAQPRVLVIEDDDAHRSTLQRHLKKSGYDVRSFDNAESALSNLQAFDPALIISDIRMGGMSGFELLKKVAPGVDRDVILMTAYEGVAGAIEAMKLGAFDYLIKPLDLDEFDEVISHCLKSRKGAPTRKDAPCDREHDLSRLIVGRDPAMLRICKIIGRVARAQTPVLIRGETGTGKELVAQAIHMHSDAANEPFITVDCTAIPETLLESSLFGNTAGAYTGAKQARKGRFELAGKGTLFLDEIGDTTVGFQSKLLRVLQEREFWPVGGEAPRKTEARILAATHQPIEDMVARREFREDLFFRLRVVEIHVPPLRDRRGDIPLLVESLLRRKAAELGRPLPVVSDRVLKALMTHDWPGNVRELENCLTRGLVLGHGQRLEIEHLNLEGAEGERARRAEDSDDRSLDSMERTHVRRVLLETGGNKSEACRLLRVSRPRLDRMLQKYEIGG